MCYLLKMGKVGGKKVGIMNIIDNIFYILLYIYIIYFINIYNYIYLLYIHCKSFLHNTI